MTVVISFIAVICVAQADCKTVTVTDIDGNVYHTITIGTQVWLTENLKTTHYLDGTAIPLVTDKDTWMNLTKAAYCNYNNSISNANKYGRLYNWYAVNTGKLAPKGWHVATDAEWTTLITYLGGESVAGGKLKSTANWNSPNTGATNSSGFSGLCGGFRNCNGTFLNVGEYAYWWSATESNAAIAWERFLVYDDTNAYRFDHDKTNGLYVRCLKD